MSVEVTIKYPGTCPPCLCPRIIHDAPGIMVDSRGRPRRGQPLISTEVVAGGTSHVCHVCGTAWTHKHPRVTIETGPVYWDNEGEVWR